MGPLDEAFLEVAAYPLGGGVGRQEFGPFGFQGLQFMHQDVELVVRHGGRIVHVIAAAVLGENAAQFLNPSLCRLLFHITYKYNINYP